MARRTVDLSARHDSLLISLMDDLGTSMVETVQRALEALEEKEAKRRKEIQGQ